MKMIVLWLLATWIVACGSDGDSANTDDTETGNDTGSDTTDDTGDDSASDETGDRDTGTGTEAAPLDCPEGAIVALTYDDALASQRNNAVSSLDSYDFQATFFLTSITSAWTAIKENGHELGAHTYNHPCTIVGNESWVSEANSSESYDLDRMAAELDEQLAALAELGQGEPNSFAYPCGTTWVGEDHTSYISLVDERFVGARGVSGSIVTSMINPMNVPAYFITSDTVDEYTAVVDNAISTGGLAVFGFHDIGSAGTMPVSVEVHDALLAYLDTNSDSVTVLPFGHAVQCMLER